MPPSFVPPPPIYKALRPASGRALPFVPQAPHLVLTGSEDVIWLRRRCIRDQRQIRAWKHQGLTLQSSGRRNCGGNSERYRRIWNIVSAIGSVRDSSGMTSISGCLPQLASSSVGEPQSAHSNKPRTLVHGLVCLSLESWIPPVRHEISTFSLR